jgi:transglutaminase-like putative cysteine protease
LRPEPFVESDAPEVRRLAAALRQKKPKATADNVFQWVAQNLKPLAPDPDPHGALHALKNGRGDCTEAMYLVMALGRAAGLPTRGVAGYVCPENAVLDPAGFHNWAEYYDGGRWRLADPLNRVFAAKGGDYVAFKIVGDNGFNRFRFSGEGLHVSMDGGSGS